VTIALGAFYRQATAGPAFIQARFGSARGLVRLGLSLLSLAGGRLKRFEDVDWSRVDRLVFVCAGNICRSPYAGARAARGGFPVISVAMRGGSGARADPHARGAARELGLSLDDHRSLAIQEADIRPGDLLLAMEPHQAFELERRYSAARRVQVTLLGLWSRPRRPHLHDPHTLPHAYFRTCFGTIDDAVETILAKVNR
jgi:protein-tyrosine phosphatase